MSIMIEPIGRVESPIKDLAQAVRQSDEGAPPVTVVLDPRVLDAITGLQPGTELMLLTWLDRADRSVLKNHPRRDPSRPITGVFCTRSPNRPNPIGLHRVRVTAINGNRLELEGLEAVDGTPVLDIKGLLAENIAER
ncbi:MAG: tRNA (N6-threonylcarbamoyladenosine(37)-N6)-methyltransferase TrmO [Gemmatimonadales bacterium]